MEEHNERYDFSKNLMIEVKAVVLEDEVTPLNGAIGIIVWGAEDENGDRPLLEAQDFKHSDNLKQVQMGLELIHDALFRESELD